MAVNLSPFAGVGAQLFDNNGNVLAGGKIYTYASGTTTPATTYTNSSGSVAQLNPIILDASGRVPSGEIWLVNGQVYKFVVNDAYGNLIATYDNITGINSNYISYTSQQEIQTATAGQTVFTLTTMTYLPNTNNLSVFVDGVNQYGPGAQYAYVETSSNVVTFENGLHVGALVKFTTATPVSTAQNAANIPYNPPFSGGVQETVAAKLSQSVTVQDFGAKGDGVTDDTSAIQAAIAFLNSSSTVDTLIFSGVFLVNYLIAQTLCTISANNKLITGGGVIKASAQSYGSGVASGAFKYYTTFLVTGNNVTIEDITIDGNNQFSQYASSGTQPNYWLNGIYFQGTNAAYLSNPTAKGVRYINGGGWPVKGQYCLQGFVNNCYVTNSQGVGFDSSGKCVVSGNTSFNSYDAHFATWNSLGAVIANNTIDTSSNGSGIDVSGSTDCTIIGNTIRNCANRGIWVLQDPNTAKTCTNVALIGNVLFDNNTYFAISEKGDIQVGPADVTSDTRPAGTVDVNGLTISGNSITSYNSSNSITLGKYAFNVLIDGNTFKSDPNTPTTAATKAISFYNSNQVIARNNNDLIYAVSGNASKVIGSGPVYYDGVDVPLDTSVAPTALGTVVKSFVKETNINPSSGKTYQIEEKYGYTRFAGILNFTGSPQTLCNIAFNSGGLEVADIQVIVTCNGGNGVRSNHVTYQGYSAVTPTQIVAAADSYSGGSSPPTITYTATTSSLAIAITGTSGVSGTFNIYVNGTREASLTPAI